MNFIKIVLGALFAVAVAYYANSIVGNVPHGGFLVLAAVFGAYMAMNIGANDVANNVGPAYGSGAISMIGVIVIAAIFEALGALIAGGDVVGLVFLCRLLASAIGNVSWKTGLIGLCTGLFAKMPPARSRRLSLLAWTVQNCFSRSTCLFNF